MYSVTQIQDCHNKRSFQKEAESLHQQLGLTFKEQTSLKISNMEHSFV